MSRLTRRKFLAQASLGAAAAGGLATGLVAVPRLVGLARQTSETPAAALGSALSEPVVAHVRNLTTGEVAVMIGTREVVYRDPELVARLVGSARRSATG